MKHINVAILITILVISACKSPNKSHEQIQPDFKMEQLNIPPEFDWKTSRTIQLVFESEYGGMAQVLSFRNNGLVLYNANLLAGNDYSMG